MKRIHFVTSIPSPYQVDFFRALEAAEPGSFAVTFCASSEIDRQYYELQGELGFNARILSHAPRRFGKDYHCSIGMLSALRQQPAKYVLLGGNYMMPDARLVRRYCSQRGIRWIFWGENPFKKAEGRLKRWMKRKYLNWFLQPATAVVGIGKAASEQYRDLSRNKPTISIPYAPNVDSLLEPSPRLLQKALEVKKNIPEADSVTFLLYAGSLIERKDPYTLLRAFADVLKWNSKVHLLIAGEGPLRERLESLAQALLIHRNVTFTGFLRGPELHAAYLAADIFVLPTAGHEGWGVVLHEAMAAGLPAVASSRVGAAIELIRDGDTGFLFNAGDSQELSRRLRNIIEDGLIRDHMGTNARLVAAALGAAPAARRLLQFLDSLDTTCE